MPRRPMRKEQAAGGDKVSVEAFEEREQGGGQNDVDDPARTDRLLKRDSGHELFADQLMPGSDECDGRDDARVEKGADEDRHPDGAVEAARTEIGAGLFRGFADGLESGHEIGDDLDHQKNGDERSVGEERSEICTENRGSRLTRQRRRRARVCRSWSSSEMSR